MVCFKHEDKEATKTCSVCGGPICDECAVVSGGTVFCKDCAAERLTAGRVHHEHGRPRYAPRPYAAKSCCSRPHHDGTPCPKQYSKFVTFILSFIFPGAGYIYTGLIKRGLTFMCTFFGAVALASVFDFELAGIAVAIVYVVSLIDSVGKCKSLNHGEVVPDDCEDILCGLRRHKKVLFIFAAIIASCWILNVASSACYYFLPDTYALRRLIRELLPIMLVVGGFYLIFKRSKPRHRVEEEYAEEIFDEGNEQQ